MYSGGFRRVGVVGVTAALVFGVVGAVPLRPAGAAVVLVLSTSSWPPTLAELNRGP